MSDEPLTPVTRDRKKMIIKFDADISELDALRFVFAALQGSAQ